jgi:hypothetical protein
MQFVWEMVLGDKRRIEKGVLAPLTCDIQILGKLNKELDKTSRSSKQN